MRKYITTGLLGLMSALTFLPATAAVFDLPTDGGDVVGQVETIRYQSSQKLMDITRKYDIGYYELLEANPKLNPMYLLSNAPIVIPDAYVLPNAPHEGIIINIAELRLYYFPAGTNQVVTMPISIGRQGWDTPTGTFKVVEKIKDPAWHVPKSIAEESAKQGVVLPGIVPAGPDNPLGAFAMRLSLPSYLIHGTNDPTSIGRRVSSGCVRMYPEDIESLFNIVPAGTPVQIVNQPYKIGWDGTKLVMEAHKPLSEMRALYPDNLQSLWAQSINDFLNQKDQIVRVDWTLADTVAKNETGIPQTIGEKTNNLSTQAT